MSNNLIDISLKQGKQFNNYQTKIKKHIRSPYTRKPNIKEGFVSVEQEMMVRPNGEGYVSVLQNQQQGTKLVNTANQKDLDDLKQLQAQYDNLVQQYTSIQKSIGDASLTSINRVSSSNPYLGKNIKFSDGTLCYVTYQGIAKQYANLDVYNNTIGKNGCPSKAETVSLNMPWLSSYIEGSIIPTNPSLIVGPNMVQGESCGSEGKNVYASKMINNPSSSYVGCYNDAPSSSEILLVPIMNSSNSVNGFQSYSSSTYSNDNNYAGPWCAFDNNIDTWWHSYDSPPHNYDADSGHYLGETVVSFYNSYGELYGHAGEFLQINFPNLNPITVTKYSIQGRQGCCGQPNGRDPNTWYILGWKDNQWYQVDYQENISFNWEKKTFNISNPQPYGAYIIQIIVAGDATAPAGSRGSVQIASWELYSMNNTAFSESDRAMIWNPDTIGYTTFDKCQDYAIDNGYQYFGMQDYKTDGTAACLVSNDITRSQMYGDATVQITEIPIWASVTGGDSNMCYISREGKLMVVDQNWSPKWESSNAPADCVNSGLIVPDSITATYGGSCANSGFNIQPGNVSQTIKNIANSMSTNANFIININNESFGLDPAVGCPKSFDTSYQCGPTWKSAHIDNAEYQSYNYDCIKEANNCYYFFVILQDDGNVCLYKGVDPTDKKELIWCTNTSVDQSKGNPNWQASKSALGVNYFGTNTVLYPGDWIGTTNGSARLIMQTDGNLVLYKADIKEGCKRDAGGKTYGGPWINAMYKLDNIGNKSALGKIGYVDADSNLREYPDSMLAYTNDYQIYENTDSAGNDITSLISSDINGCQTACNGLTDCAGVVYQGSTSSCFLKNKNAYPKGEKQFNKTLVFGARKQKINGSSGCSNQIVEVDTIQYDNYTKGDAMTPDTKCNVALVSQEDRLKFDNIKTQLSILGHDIASKMENLYNQDNKIYEKLNTNATKFKKDLEKYKNVNMAIKKELELESNNNIEGMQNFNMNDINGMLSDSDLRVLQDNYSYLLWSILAVGVLTITINTMRK